MKTNPWKDLATALDDLCTCYRVHRRPSGQLLDKIAALRIVTAEYDLSQKTRKQGKK